MNQYQGKDLTGTQAALAYACGIPHGDIRVGGIVTVDGSVRDLRTPNGLRNAVRTRSLVVNPITEAAWDDTAAIERRLSNDEKRIFAEAAPLLDTGAAEHHAALLLAHLRAAKNETKINHPDADKN